MNLATKIFTGTALTLAIGASAIFGNAYLASTAATQSMEGEPVVVSDSLTPSTGGMNVVALSAQTGNTVLTQGRMDSVPTRTQEEIEILIEKKLNVYRDNGYSEEQIAEIRAKMKNKGENPTYVEGIPGEGDIAAETAIETAMSTIKEKYALTDATISRFDTNAGFNIVNPDAPQWNISLYPKNNADFSDIGCYHIILDAKTGEAVEITSAADGRG